eukprot:gene12169-12307_t
MTLSSSPDSDGLQQLSQGPSSSAEQVQDPPRKLAVLGLPWDTSEDTLRLHFSQYGAIEATDIMKDRLSGKSRGFGFVTFVDPAAAARALQIEHTIDGRRCEAKVALPKNLLQGDMAPSAARTTRIFVARIPQSVTDTQFRTYFEKYGRLQDAYMPRDHSRQMYRGIGFVTFASSESVEKVMACKHWLNGHEIAIDRATPKEDSRSSHSHSTALSAASKMGPSSRRSFDNGAGINLTKAALFPGAPLGQFPLPGLAPPLGPPLGALPGPDTFANPMFAGLPGVPGIKPPSMASPVNSNSRKSLDSVLHSSGSGNSVGTGASRRSSENPAIQSVRAGPRIFIGKLTKDTTESDVKEYFGRFGFVMDVYMPKAKDNKAEHRGFGFVTFETDAAIKRVVGAGTHKLKGSTIAIDIAMPKLDDDLGLELSGVTSNSLSPGTGNLGANVLGGLPARSFGPAGNAQFDAMAAGMMAAAAAAQQFSARSSLPIM